MAENAGVPAKLRVLGWLFILWGVAATAAMIWQFVRGFGSFNVGVVAIFIGRGLLRRSPSWRLCALAFGWVIVLASAAAILKFQMHRFGLGLFPANLISSGTLPGLAVALVTLAAALWSLWVLKRPEVEGCFAAAAEGGTVPSIWRGPGWEVAAPADFPAFLRSLRHLVGGGAILYLEGVEPGSDVEAYLAAHPAPDARPIRRATLWPKPLRFHVPATQQTLTALADLAETNPGSSLCHHLHVYRDGLRLIEWYDVSCDDPFFLSNRIPEAVVTQFCDQLGLTALLVSQYGGGTRSMSWLPGQPDDQSRRDDRA